MLIVSACLAGVDCRWDRRVVSSDKVIELVRRSKAIPVCPAQLGGLPTPRLISEQVGGKVIRKDGVDVTAEFEKGASEALRLAKLAGCRKAILKSKSAMCGSGKVYDGTFSKTLTDGDGIFARLLKENGIEVVAEDGILKSRSI